MVELLNTWFELEQQLVAAQELLNHRIRESFSGKKVQESKRLVTTFQKKVLPAELIIRESSVRPK